MDLSALPVIGEYLAANPYLHAIAIFVFFFAASFLMVFAGEKLLLRLTSKTKTDIDDLLIKRTNKPIAVLLMLFGLRFAVDIFKVSSEIAAAIDRIFFVMIVFGVAYILMVVIDVFIDNWSRKWAEKTESKMDDYIITMLHRLFRILVIAFAFIYILNSWGVEITPILAGLGVAGIAVAFAMQSSLSNIFSGIFMIVDKTVKVGDVIELDKETTGTVVDVGLRSTRIRSWNNEIMTIPNSKVADAKVLNFAQPDPTVRVVIPFSVAYGSKIGKVKSIVLKEIKQINGALKEPEPMVMFTEMGQSSLNFNAYFWVEHFTMKFAAKDEANTRIYNALNKARITIPYPQMDVHIKRR